MSVEDIDCQHYDLGPADEEGISICADCGAAVQVRVGGLPIEEYYRRSKTVVSKEGDDVPYLRPGEG